MGAQKKKAILLCGWLSLTFVACGKGKTTRPQREDHIHSIEVHNKIDRVVHIRFRLKGDIVGDDCHKPEDEAEADIAPQTSATLTTKLSCRESPDGDIFVRFEGDEPAKERMVDPRSGISTVEISSEGILVCEGHQTAANCTLHYDDGTSVSYLW